MSAVLIYVTTSSRDEAETIARAVVGDRLAACANVLADVTSFFWWEGGVQAEKEVSLILKSREDLVEALTAKIKQLHSYDCPCVVAVSISQGNPDFLEWIAAETT
jgi:periplasmic divalent cation tolerance protein